MCEIPKGGMSCRPRLRCGAVQISYDTIATPGMACRVVVVSRTKPVTDAAGGGDAGVECTVIQRSGEAVIEGPLLAFLVQRHQEHMQTCSREGAHIKPLLEQSYLRAYIAYWHHMSLTLTFVHGIWRLLRAIDTQMQLPIHVSIRNGGWVRASRTTCPCTRFRVAVA